ncbi:MAG TPA: 16S rRNA (adenine(1518)-N(6)/adenine(1519)-N(6))-dimethyltransferase RsmA [Verrucomicrobiae bacterium]|jgi:16S rRNA (adenine1518-N6/adenine1519-N6)-dimethyltransferase|nr:16S rRNA (adenine(1518)-N(6)/adenine(1519)-N(6))-dimethyltransferase RsmA [Verrucomicrobiae bacterium]
MSLYQEARAALKETDFRPRKRLGQNFLIHEAVLDSIMRLVEPAPEDEILEIGPGLGSLTRRLVERARHVWAVEVDPKLVAKLRAGTLGSNPVLELIEGDVLELPLESILPERKIKLVANLPYSISTPVLFRLFEMSGRFSFFVLMVQREVAERMASGPGSKSYGALSVWCQIYGRITAKVPVAPEAFLPRPKVRSMVLKIEPYPQPLVTVDELPVFRGLVRAAFGQRRKTLENNLTAWLKSPRGEVDRLLRQQGIEPRRRGETLSLDEFIRLGRSVTLLKPHP